jgi:hypothetical protein
MAPKHHPTPLSGGDRKALKKELGKARAMATVFARQANELRTKGEALVREADRLLCESWNERMWANGEPIDPSPTIDQALNGGLSMARDRMLALQDTPGRRPCRTSPSANDVRP